MKLTPKITFIIGLVSLFLNVNAQQDKVHYIPPFFAPADASGDVGKQWLVISTQEEVAFDVAIMRGSTVYDTVSVSKTDPQLIYLGSGFTGDDDPTGVVKEDSLNTVLKRQAFTLSADYPFFTAVYQKSGAQGDVLTCKGETALGNEFYSGHIVSEYSSADSRRGLFVSVMAAFDNTSITISNPRVTYEGESQNTMTVTLNKGESYVVGTSNNAAKSANYVLNDYNGTKITSNKPVAVNTGSWCGSANTANSQDIGIDQLVPVNFVGNEYILVEGQGTSLGEQAVVVATQAGTELYVNGSLVYTFSSQGDYYIVGQDSYSANDNMYMYATDNIYVFQTLSGQYSDVSVGLCFIPPLSCLSNREVNISYADQIGSPLLSIITEVGAEVTINGKAIEQTAKEVTGNADWVTYKVSNSETTSYDSSSPKSFEIVSTKAINAALSFESGVIGGAGYYSGFGISPLLQATPTVDGTEACYPDNAVLVASGYDEYVWYKDYEVIEGETGSTYSPTETGSFSVSGKTACGITKASDPYVLRTCLTLEGGGTYDESTGDVLVYVRLGIVSDQDVNYWYRTLPGTANEGEDYVSNVGLGTIVAGELFDTIAISIKDDAKFEAEDETFTFDVYYSDNATVKNALVEFTIADNDAKPQVSAPPSVSVQEDADTVFVSFSKNGATQDSLWFDYATTDGSAIDGSAYEGVSGTLYFGPDDNVKYVSIPIIDNLINNYALDFTLNYSNAENVTLTETQTTITINDDEETSTCLSLVDSIASVTEGEALALRVELEKIEGVDISFQFVLNSMTTDSADFTPLSDETFTLKAGTKDTTLFIYTVQDTVPENDELFSYTLVNVVNAKSCSGSVEFTIENDDYIPDLRSDSYSCDEDTWVNGNVLANDIIVGDTPVVVAFENVESGTLQDLGQGNFTFTPWPDFFGVAQFTYSVTDLSGDVRESTASVEVRNINDLPIAHPDTILGYEDSVLVIFPLANDEDIDKTGLRLESLTAASLGNFSIADDYITYTPLSDVFGNDTLMYTMSDGDGDGANAYIYITLQSVNDVPVGLDDAYDATEDTSALVLDVLANDLDKDGSGLGILRLNDVVGGSAEVVNDEVIFTLFENFWGTASFNYTLYDGEGDTAVAAVSIAVAPTNDLPIAHDDTLILDEDVPTSINVLSNDEDDDQRGLDMIYLSEAQHGDLNQINGVVSYTPPLDFCGLDTFSYTVRDYNGDESSAQVFVTVACVNEAPLAYDDDYTIQEDAPAIDWDVLINDVDKDGSGLTISSIYDISSGVAEIQDDKIRYTAAANFSGEASLYYVVNDGEGDKDTALVSITVTAVNDAPVAEDDIYTYVIENGQWPSVELDVIANDFDPDLNDEIKQVLIQIAPTQGGTVLGDDSLTIIYSPDFGFEGQDSLAYRLVDNNGTVSNTAWVLIHTERKDDIVYAIDDTIVVMEDDTYELNPLLVNWTIQDDTIVMKDALDDEDYTPVDPVKTTYGEIQIHSNSLWEYIPAADFYGSDTIFYWVEETDDEMQKAMMLIDVLPVNDAPLCHTAPQLTLEIGADSSLLCDPGYWTDVDGEITITYAWYGLFEGDSQLLASSSDQLLLADSLKKYDIWCVVTARDDGYPLPAQELQLATDTIAAFYHKAQDLLLSSDTIYRSWETMHKVADLISVAAEDGEAYTYTLLDGEAIFSIVDQALYLDTAGLNLTMDSISITIEVAHAILDELSTVFEFSLKLVDDLCPLMESGYPYIQETFDDSVSIAVMVDRPAYVYYSIYESGDSSNWDISTAEKVEIPAGEVFYLGQGGLESYVGYDVVIYLADTTESSFSEAFTLSFTTGDIMAPEFIALTPYVDRTSVDSAWVVVATNERATLFYQLYEQDSTVSSDGAYLVDTAMVLDDTCILEEGLASELALGHLRSQMRYHMVLRAADSLNNQSPELYLSFTTLDTITPFFIAHYPYINSIINRELSYYVQSSEPTSLQSRLAYSDGFSDFEEVDNEAIELSENEMQAIAGPSLEFDGEYRLELTLVDTAGNVSSMKRISFYYPDNLGMELKNTVIHQGEFLEFVLMNLDADYVLYNVEGRLLASGHISKDIPRVDVDFLSDGTYIIRVKNQWVNKSFQFMKSTRQRP